MSKDTKIILISVAIIITIVIAVNMFFPFNNEEKDAFTLLTSSSTNVRELSKIDCTLQCKVNLNFQEPEMEEINEIFNDVTIKYNILQDLDNSISEAKINIMYKDELALNIDIYADENNIIMNVPSLYERPFYITLDDYSKLISNSESGMEFKPFDFKKAREFQENFYSLDNIEGAEIFDGDKYESIAKQQLEGLLHKGEKISVIINKNGREKKVACQKIELNFNETQAIDFFVALLKEAQYDETLKNIILTKAEEYIQFTESLLTSQANEDLEEKSSFDICKDSLKDIKENYSEGIGNLLNELETIKKEASTESFETNNIIAFDKSDTLRYLNSNITINTIDKLPVLNMNSLDIHFEYTVNSYNKKLKFTTYTNLQESCVNLTEVFEDPQGEKANDLMLSISGSVMKEVSTNSFFKILAEKFGNL